MSLMDTTKLEKNLESKAVWDIMSSDSETGLETGSKRRVAPLPVRATRAKSRRAGSGQTGHGCRSIESLRAAGCRV